MNRRWIAGAAIAAAVTLGLTGCANPLEGLVSSATKGQVDLSGRSVPASFPKTVPLYNGAVTSGVELGQDKSYIWNVIMVVPGPSVMRTISNQLAKAGYTTQLETDDDCDLKTLVYDNNDYDVAVVLKHSGNGYTVDYAVSTQTDGDDN